MPDATARRITDTIGHHARGRHRLADLVLHLRMRSMGSAVVNMSAREHMHMCGRRRAA